MKLEQQQRRMLAALIPNYKEYVFQSAFLLGFFSSLVGLGFSTSLVAFWFGFSDPVNFLIALSMSVVFGGLASGIHFLTSKNLYTEMVWRTQELIAEIDTNISPEPIAQQPAPPLIPGPFVDEQIDSKSTWIKTPDWEIECPQPGPGALARFLRQSLNGQTQFSMRQAEDKGWTRNEFKKMKDAFLEVGWLDGNRKLNGVPMWTEKAQKELRGWLKTCNSRGAQIIKQN